MNDKHFQQLVTDQFPSLSHMVYANHAAISPWPRVTRDMVENFATEMCEVGPLRAGRWLQRETSLRNLVARMLNASSGDDIALLKNTTEGICMVANGIDWQAGDNLVMPTREFPSNQMVWDALTERGVEVRKVDIQGSEDPESDLLNALDARSRVLTVSSVQWESGFRLKLEKLGQACSNTATLFFVDAIQQFAALPIDVVGCGIDALSAGAHKWQMGPEGIAVFYCNEATRGSLALTQHGWRMLDDPYRFALPDRGPSATARRFEAGSPNTLGQAALFASLALLEEVGFGQVEQRILDNTRRLSDGISRLAGIQLVSSTDPARYSGIVSFVSNEADPDALRRELSKSKCFVAVRDSALRVSPHFYQNGPPLKRLLNAIEATVQSIN